MSSLYKLSILGIRSFSPKDHETIQFGSPLTLICGQNGCGKTTVIECLKYATTGDLPPNSKGGAFVNDPAIADRLIVNAEIKLGYISVDGKLMTVTRNMQLTRKRGTRGSATTNTFKTLEGQLAVISRGHKTAISTKNAELDVRVPQYLGASKAILDYVIFCHQDDSLWPLSEAGVLKKRFDEIFEALKFTKVLDNLKAIKKDMAVDIKLTEQSVQHAKVDKVRAQKIKEKLEDSTEKVEQYTLEIVELTVRIERLEKKAEDLFNLNQSFQKTLSEYERLKMTLENTESNYLRLKNSITILPDSDDQLAHQLANFAEIQQQKAFVLKEKESLKLEIEKQLTETHSRLQELTKAEGSLESKTNEYLSNVENLSELSKQLRKDFEIDEDIDNDEFKDELDKIHRHVASTHEELVNDNKSKLNVISEKVRDVRDRITKEQQHSIYCAEDIQSTIAKIEENKESLAKLALDEDSLELERSQLQLLENKLEKRKEKSNFKELQEENDTNKLKLLQLETELDALVRKIIAGNKQSDIHSKIDLLKESKTLKGEILRKSLEAHRARFTELTGSNLEAVSCEPTLEECIKKISVEKENLQTLLEESNNKLSSLKASSEGSERALKDLETKFKDHQDRILKVFEENEIPDYEKLLKELEEDHKSAVYNLNTFEVTKSYKLKAIEIAKRTKCCTLCNRGFNGAELSKFEIELQENVNSFTAEKLTEDVEATMKDLQEMKDVHFDVLQYRKLLLDKELMLKEHGVHHAEIETLTQQNDVKRSQLEQVKLKSTQLMDLKKPIESLHRVFSELSEIESQLLVLEDELQEYGASLSSMAELQKEQQQKNYEVKSLRQTISDSTEEINTQQKELSKLENQVKDKQLLISNMENALSESISLKNSISDRELHAKSLQEKREKIETILKNLNKELENQTKELDSITHSCSEAEKKSKSKLEKISSSVAGFESLLRAIKYYEEHDKAKVERIKIELSEVAIRADELKVSRSEMEQEIKAVEAEINDATKVERNIHDNVELRQTEKDLDSINEKINQIDIQNAELEKEKYQLASRKLREQIAELNAQHSGKVGEVKQIKDHIKLLQNDLSTDFKDIDKQYHSEWIKLQTNMLVSNDLQTYSQALDNAIMKYHSMKMNEINRILRELWNQTYRGTDIDGIEIKCDVNTQARGRSYNYRVVMYKKNSELDMRGRCSAGQKVLTSILIRLALAECFGANCGMIALDEPTTNLDVENAESLAMALNSIIDFRKNQKNFQLIVITHDEQFLSHINGDRYTDNFYRIERDENQNSIIKSLPIHLMQDD